MSSYSMFFCDVVCVWSYSFDPNSIFYGLIQLCHNYDPCHISNIIQAAHFCKRGCASLLIGTTKDLEYYILSLRENVFRSVDLVKKFWIMILKLTQRSVNESPLIICEKITNQIDLRMGIRFPVDC